MITKKNLKIENEELKATIRDLNEENNYLMDNNVSYKRDNEELCQRLNVIGERLDNFSLELTKNREYIEQLENTVKELTKYKNMYDAEENIAKDLVSSIRKNSGALGYSLDNLFGGDILGNLNNIFSCYKK